MDQRIDQKNERIDIRVKPLVLKIPGSIPTLPYPLSLKIGSRGWKVTDLADGEYCINSADNIFFWRSGDQILSFDPSQFTSIYLIAMGLRAGKETLVAGWNTIPLKIFGVITPYSLGDQYTIPRAYCKDSTGSVVEAELQNFTINSFDVRISTTDPGTIDYITMKV